MRAKIILLTAIFYSINGIAQSRTVSVDTIDCFLYLRFDTCAGYEFINSYILFENTGKYKNIPLYDDLSLNDLFFKKHKKTKKKFFKGSKNAIEKSGGTDTYSTLFEKLIHDNYMNYSVDSSSSCRFLNSNAFYLPKNEVNKDRPNSYYLVIKSKLVVFNYSKGAGKKDNQAPVKRPSLNESNVKWWCADYLKIDSEIFEFSVLYKLIDISNIEANDNAILKDFGLDKSKSVSIKICSSE